MTQKQSDFPIQQARDAALKRLLKTPPEPHADHAKKQKESRTPPAKG